VSSLLLTQWYDQCFATNDQAFAQRVRLLTIWLGANDACLEFSPQHVPLDVFTANIRRLVQMVRSPTSPRYWSHTRIILLTAPPVNTYQLEAELAGRDPPEKLDRDFNVTRQYAEAVKSVGLQESVPVVDLWTIIYEAAQRDERKLEKFLCDGLHLKTEAYQVGLQNAFLLHTMLIARL
jgi:lysophospholipase L1-like esterase